MRTQVAHVYNTQCFNPCLNSEYSCRRMVMYASSCAVDAADIASNGWLSFRRFLASFFALSASLASASS